MKTKVMTKIERLNIGKQILEVSPIPIPRSLYKVLKKELKKRQLFDFLFKVSTQRI
jgi:hypothetical protein